MSLNDVPVFSEMCSVEYWTKKRKMSSESDSVQVDDSGGQPRRRKEEEERGKPYMLYEDKNIDVELYRCRRALDDEGLLPLEDPPMKGLNNTFVQNDHGVKASGPLNVKSEDVLVKELDLKSIDPDCSLKSPVKQSPLKRKKRCLSTYKSDAVWNEKFQLLKEYKERFGDCLVPKAFPEGRLGEWVSWMRALYKKREHGQEQNTLTDDRVALLESIGFRWKLRSRGSTGKMVSWNDRYKELVEYKRVTGDCNVISKNADGSHEKLANWVSNQRTAFKMLKTTGKANIKISADRIRLLQEIGFDFTRRSRSYQKKTEVISEGSTTGVSPSGENRTPEMQRTIN